MFSRIIICLIGCFITLILFEAKASPTKLELIAIYNEGKVGDQNQIKGIKDALSKRYGNIIKIIEFKDTQVSEVRTLLQNKKVKRVILASGEPGIKFYDSIKESI